MKNGALRLIVGVQSKYDVSVQGGHMKIAWWIFVAIVLFLRFSGNIDNSEFMVAAIVGVVIMAVVMNSSSCGACAGKGYLAVNGAKCIKCGGTGKKK